MLIGKEELRQLIPHGGRMCLLDGVQDWDDESICCATATHRAADHPLRHAGRLAAIHLAEYGAQAMAVHGGLLAARAGGRAEPGLLVALREVELLVERADELPAPLLVRAQRLVGGASGRLYAFEVGAGTEVYARGRVSVILRGP